MQEEQKKRRRTKRLRRARGQLHITPDTKSGIYYITGTVRGIRVRESTGTSDAATADALRVKKETELLTESVHGRKSIATFGECVAHYLRVKDGGSNRRYLAKLVAHFGDWKARDLTTSAVHAYAVEHHPKSTGLSRNIAVINPIITALRCAAQGGLCDFPAIQRFEGGPKKIVGPGEAWINEFLAKCQTPKIKAYVMLLTTTGCRGIDARRLRSEDIDYVKGTGFLPKTKNDDARTLELVEPLLALLKSFPHAANGTVFGYNWTGGANEAIEAECKRIGMPYHSGHKIGRHAIAERLLAQGWTLKEVADAVGWRDITTLYKRYGHLEQSRVRAKLREAAAETARGTLRVVNGGKG